MHLISYRTFCCIKISALFILWLIQTEWHSDSETVLTWGTQSPACPIGKDRPHLRAALNCSRYTRNLLNVKKNWQCHLGLFSVRSRSLIGVGLQVFAEENSTVNGCSLSSYNEVKYYQVPLPEIFWCYLLEPCCAGK